LLQAFFPRTTFTNPLPYLNYISLHKIANKASDYNLHYQRLVASFKNYSVIWHLFSTNKYAIQFGWK